MALGRRVPASSRAKVAFAPQKTTKSAAQHSRLHQLCHSDRDKFPQPSVQKPDLRQALRECAFRAVPSGAVKEEAIYLTSNLSRLQWCVGRECTPTLRASR
eukprot:3735682-Amphidinium_carterae.1